MATKVNNGGLNIKKSYIITFWSLKNDLFAI
jgi:hypothetical protein